MKLHRLISALPSIVILIATLLSNTLLIYCLDEPETTTTPPTRIFNHPICIVGAGISGLNIASLLEERGNFVQVFEKEPVVGGKIKTFRVPGEIQVEMCALLHTSALAKLLKKKLAQFQLTTMPVPYDQVGFNPHTGQILPKVNLTPGQIAAIREAVKSYVYYREVVYKKDLESFGHLNVSSDLFVPVSAWLKSKGLEVITPIFTLMLTVEGYGNLDDLPTLYAMMLVDESLAAGLASEMSGVFFTVKEGLDVLVDRMASSLKKKVNVNREVVKVERRGINKVISFKNFGQRICKQVILAFPPLLPNLEKMIPDLNGKERAILDQVKISNYISAANYIPPLSHMLYGNPAPEGTGGVNAFIKQSTLSRQNIFSSYSWIRGAFNRTATPSELLNVKEQLRGTIKRMSNNQGETFLIRTTEYFPHVNTAALQAGFYQDFNSLQGVNGIYYATPLLSFEIVENALAMTEGFVQRFF